MSQMDSISILRYWKETLKEHNFRVTRPRILVMDIITSSEVPLTPQEIYQRTLNLDDSPGIASVYRTLEVLDDLGLIQQIHQSDGCHQIWPALEGHKHFLICENCGHIRVIEGSDQMSAYISDIEDQTGYQVSDHLLQFFGLCEGCA